MGIITWARLAVCAPQGSPQTSRSLLQTPIPPSLSSYSHHLASSLPTYTMPRRELKQTKRSAAPRKRADKSESATAPGKSGSSSAKTKKDKLANPHEAKKELERLFALSTAGEDSNSGLKEDSGEGLGWDEGRENVSNGDRRRGKRRDRSQFADEDDEEVEDKSEHRGTETRQRQGGVEAKRVQTKKKKNLACSPAPVVGREG